MYNPLLPRGDGMNYWYKDKGKIIENAFVMPGLTLRHAGLDPASQRFIGDKKTKSVLTL